MEKILNYLITTYQPLAILVYGSYGDGTENLHSDFDALVVTRDHPHLHDMETVAGVPLDVFVYPLSHFGPDFTGQALPQLYHSRVVLDTEGVGEALRQRVMEDLNREPWKSEEELEQERQWCRKMAKRAQGLDAEGLFRWHWLLVDSLEIYCDVLHQRYWGPKKTLRWMEVQRPEDYAVYLQALRHMDQASLSQWMDCLLGTKT
jgi:hypothetical protein